MTLKRQGAIQSYMPVAKRLKSLDKRVRKLYRCVDTKPEWFTNPTGASTIATGTVVTQEIVGHNPNGQTKLLNLEVIVYGSGVLDVYLVQCNLGTAPSYSNFSTPTIGSPLRQGDGTQYHVWKHAIVPSDGIKCARFRLKFPMGFSRDADGLGANQGKALYLVIKNDTGSTLNYAANITGYAVSEFL